MSDPVVQIVVQEGTAMYDGPGVTHEPVMAYLTIAVLYPAHLGAADMSIRWLTGGSVALCAEALAHLLVRWPEFAQAVFGLLPLARSHLSGDAGVPKEGGPCPP